jgi:hypothetical protein
LNIISERKNDAAMIAMQRQTTARSCARPSRSPARSPQAAHAIRLLNEATVMNKSESLKRAAECTRLVEATSDPDMQAYLLKLGLSWMRLAAERDQRPPEEDRRLKTLQDLIG